jgi:GPH family glycoside/pentoside/hexuronide:cation symporter
MLFFIVVLLLVGVVQPGGQNLMLVAAVLGGLGYGAASSIPWALVADVVEADELKSGQRREGLYYGYLVFFRKLAGAISAFLASALLGATGYLSTNLGSVPLPQPPEALMAMRLLVSVIPAVLLLLAVLVAWRYPLDREAYNDIRRQLQERRQLMESE